VLEKTGLVNHEQVNFQQTSPPKLPKDQTTPPPPQTGSPVLVLNIPKGLEDLQTSAPAGPVSPAPAPSAG
jgi:hypothetical protein